MMNSFDEQHQQDPTAYTPGDWEAALPHIRRAERLHDLRTYGPWGIGVLLVLAAVGWWGKSGDRVVQPEAERAQVAQQQGPMEWTAVVDSSVRADAVEVRPVDSSAATTEAQDLGRTTQWPAKLLAVIPEEKADVASSWESGAPEIIAEQFTDDVGAFTDEPFLAGPVDLVALRLRNPSRSFATAKLQPLSDAERGWERGRMLRVGIWHQSPDWWAVTAEVLRRELGRDWGLTVDLGLVSDARQRSWSAIHRVGHFSDKEEVLTATSSRGIAGLANLTALRPIHPRLSLGLQLSMQMDFTRHIALSNPVLASSDADPMGPASGWGWVEEAGRLAMWPGVAVEVAPHEFFRLTGVLGWGGQIQTSAPIRSGVVATEGDHAPDWMARFGASWLIGGKHEWNRR